MNILGTALPFDQNLPEHPSPAPDSGSDTFNLDFRKVALIVRRNILVIVGIMALALGLGLVATLLTTPKYIAKATVQIDQEAARVLNTTSLEPTAGYQDADRFLQTQLDVLRSRALAERVARSLGLFGNTSFFTAMGAQPPGAGTSGAGREAVLSLLENNLTVKLPRESRVAEIAFESRDPVLGARIANAYAAEFIQSNLQRKFDSSSYARDFLSRQLAEAKQRLEQSERAVNDYSRGIGLIRLADPTTTATGGNAGQRSVTTASLVQLNQAANDARATRIAAEGRWRSASGAALLSIPEVLANTAMQRIMEQRSIIQGQLQQERARHLPDHPSVIQLEAQAAEANRQMNTLAQSIRESIRKEYDTAQAREAALTAQVEQLKGATLTEQDRSVRYGILSREADTNRTLYDGLLQRFKELSAEAGMSVNNISIIDLADTPLAPSSPKLMLNLLLAFVVGLGTAGLAVLIREQIDDTIRAPEDVEAKLNLPLLGVIPAAKEPVEQALASPRSSVSEAYNALRTSLNYSTPQGLPQLIITTSTRAAEGKSTTSYAIASSVARLGRRVALIDVDLRRPSLHRLMDMPNDIGFSDLLVAGATLDQVLHPTAIERLSFIPSGPIPPSPTELLESGTMADIIAQLRAHFDVIVLDGPPVLGLADAPLLSSHADGTVFVIEANRGQRGATKAALRRLRGHRVHLLGTVLTKFDVTKASSAYSYYGYEYYQYGAANEAASER